MNDKELSTEALRQTVAFLNEVGNGHIYAVEKFFGKYTMWPAIQEELVSTEAMNVKDGMFGMDASMPVRYLRLAYQDKLKTRNAEEQRRRNEMHYWWFQTLLLALSVILSATSLIVSLTK